jgi:hypothetical protein
MLNCDIFPAEIWNLNIWPPFPPKPRSRNFYFYVIFKDFYVFLPWFKALAWFIYITRSEAVNYDILYILHTVCIYTHAILNVLRYCTLANSFPLLVMLCYFSLNEHNALFFLGGDGEGGSTGVPVPRLKEKKNPVLEFLNNLGGLGTE